MKLNTRSTLSTIGGSLAAYIGFLTMCRGLWGMFDDERSTFGGAVLETLQEALIIGEATIMQALTFAVTMLILHLSGIPKPWVPFFRLANILFVPFMIWALSLLALNTTPGLRYFPFSFLGHPLWLLFFLLGGLAWWIVALFKVRRTYICTGWA